MASDADLFAEARQHMVDSQIRPNKVTDPRILDAMRHLPRERFLPPSLISRAYSDVDVPLGNGRVLMEPMVLARLVQIAAPSDGDRVLVIGAGSGYGSAVLAMCGCRVTALEEDKTLFGFARRVLAEIAPGVTLVAGPLGMGCASGAPYDIVFIEGAVSHIPPALGSQLRNDGGRLVGVMCGSGRASQAVLAEPTALGLRTRVMFDCGTPPFPSLMPAPVFEF